MLVAGLVSCSILQGIRTVSYIQHAALQHFGLADILTRSDTDTLTLDTCTCALQDQLEQGHT